MRSIQLFNFSGFGSVRISTLLTLRWFAIVGQAVTVALVTFWLGFDLPVGLCSVAIGLSFCLNIVLRMIYRRSDIVSGPVATFIFVFDIIQPGLLLFLTGGIQNPFSILLMVPVVVSVVNMPTVVTFALGALAILVLSIITMVYFPLPWNVADTPNLPPLYQFGIFFSIVLSLIFVSTYTWRLVAESRKIQRALYAAEISLSREQNLSNLDGLAAAAAHALGSPLGTINLISKELLISMEENHPHYEDIALLNQEVRRCRDILANLLTVGSEITNDINKLSPAQLLTYVAKPLQHFGKAIEIKSKDVPSSLTAIPYPAVVFSLSNLLENAIDFSKNKVEVHIEFSSGKLTISILDDGPGFSEEMLERIGQPYFTTRPQSDFGQESMSSLSEVVEHEGMGLGFFVANALLQKTGAQVEAINRSDGQSGAQINITWSEQDFRDLSVSNVGI